ncbi:MFS transporter [Tamlana sp. I1]|uniref:MFS transporter n=1 Tax=Tamlana sp. I1 TaxID=2762061 RepID=UPI0018906967|nr:MFS transporter [Tamlana sp. I1]
MNQKLKTIKIIHFAICAGVIAAYVFLGNLTSFENLNFPVLDASSIMYLIIPISAIFLGNFLYASQKKNVDRKLSLEERIPFYQSATIIRLAILEGAAFLILFLKPEFIVFGILIILYMIFLRPTENQFKKDFENTNL